jgi:hypothetical protein
MLKFAPLVMLPLAQKAQMEFYVSTAGSVVWVRESELDCNLSSSILRFCEVLGPHKSIRLMHFVVLLAPFMKGDTFPGMIKGRAMLEVRKYVGIVINVSTFSKLP